MFSRSISAGLVLGLICFFSAPSSSVSASVSANLNGTISLSSPSFPALPLSASDRWIVDATGNQVRLACVNWPTHMEAMLPEGLQHNSADNIAALVGEMGFNCVRLSYSIDFALLVPSPTTTPTARQSLSKLQLNSAITGFAAHNPTLLDASILDSFIAVVEALNNHSIMVLLDNHVSKAQWCCGGNDGNGWWGEKFFDPTQWLQGLKNMATQFAPYKNVIAMDLRNELRDSTNQNEWMNYMTQGLTTLHDANPNVLLFVSGFNYDTDLGFLYSNPIQQYVSSSIRSKLVYEGHAYSWSGYGNNCNDVTRAIGNKWGYLIASGKQYTAPLVVSEWGLNVDGYPGGDAWFGDCMIEYIAGNGMSWGFWVLGGSYYIRNGQAESEESFGLLDATFTSIKKPQLVAKFKAIHTPMQETVQQAIETVKNLDVLFA